MIKKTKDGKNWYEDSFPPKHRMVSRFRGYDTWNERMLFYEFAVNHYDMFLVYNGKKYIFEIDSEGVRMVDDKQSIDRPFVRTEVDLRVRKMVQVIGKSSLPRRQIVADLGLRQQSRRNFIYNYLKPAVAQGYVTMSFPGSPNKPEQTYRLTEKGLDLYKKVMGE